MQNFKFSASRHLQDRGILLETEAKAPRFEVEAVKITPRGCLKARQCLEAPYHWYRSMCNMLSYLLMSSCNYITLHFVRASF